LVEIKMEINPKVNTKVRLKGEVYWLLSELAEGDGQAIAPPHHCGQDGEILPEYAFADSFAHLWPDGRITRYGQRIGMREDLEVAA
jgi:hypothetical protein